jgi:hypothetical protein
MRVLECAQHIPRHTRISLDLGPSVCIPALFSKHHPLGFRDQSSFADSLADGAIVLLRTKKTVQKQDWGRIGIRDRLLGLVQVIGQLDCLRAA